MKTKHTKGKWSISRNGHIKSGDNAETWEGVCQVLGGGEEAEANAKLIIAAPEMLEALQWFVERCEKGEVRSKKTYARYKELIKKTIE